MIKSDFYTDFESNQVCENCGSEDATYYDDIGSYMCEDCYSDWFFDLKQEILSDLKKTVSTFGAKSDNHLKFLYNFDGDDILYEFYATATGDVVLFYATDETPVLFKKELDLSLEKAFELAENVKFDPNLLSATVTESLYPSLSSAEKEGLLKDPTTIPNIKIISAN